MSLGQENTLVLDRGNAISMASALLEQILISLILSLWLSVSFSFAKKGVIINEHLKAIFFPQGLMTPSFPQRIKY